MLKLAVIAVALGLAFAAEWEEGENAVFAGWTHEQKKALLGTRLDGAIRSSGTDRLLQYSGASLPTSFTSGMDKWQVCKNIIFEIKNQAQCGSCWAVAASEQFEDRWCINCMQPSSKNDTAQRKLWLSAENLMACCQYCGDGCEGGYPQDAMNYLKKHGIPTGGPWGSHCGCQPYKVKPKRQERPTPKCQSKCEKNYPVSFNEDLHKANDTQQIAGNANAIMEAIMNYGPVECAFSVYQNFFDYKSGVYTKATGGLDGGHAIKIIGWGQQQQNGKMVKYWLINNSWGTDWGMKGQFKFLRGTDLCGMESQCVSATPNCQNHNAASNTYTCVKH